MALIPRYIGRDEVIEAFEKKAKQPYFSMWDKSAPICQYNGDDFNEAIEMIEDEIKLNNKRGYTNPLTIKLHSESEKIYTTKSPCYCSFAFICQDQPIITTPTVQPADINGYYQSQINSLRAEIDALKMKEIEPDDEEEEDEEEDDDQLGSIGKILDHPLVSGLINKIIANPQRVSNLAGIDNGEAEHYLNVLYSKGLTLDHLRKLAEMPESKITMLLNML